MSPHGVLTSLHQQGLALAVCIGLVVFQTGVQGSQCDGYTGRHGPAASVGGTAAVEPKAEVGFIVGDAAEGL